MVAEKYVLLVLNLYLLVKRPTSVKDKVSASGLDLQNGTPYLVMRSEADYKTFLGQNTTLTKTQYLINFCILLTLTK